MRTPPCGACDSFRSPVGLHVRVIECATGTGLPGGSIVFGTYSNFEDEDDCFADQLSIFCQWKLGPVWKVGFRKSL